MSDKKPRLTVRLTPNQMLVVNELTKALDTNPSVLIRMIVGNWLVKNEEYIYGLIERRNGPYKEFEEETEVHPGVSDGDERDYGENECFLDDYFEES